MFTGIIEGTGTLISFKRLKQGARIRVRPSFPLKDIKIGDSIAVNGCCLTVIASESEAISRDHSGDGHALRARHDTSLTPPNSYFEADLSHETLRVTNLGFLKPGDTINLERPLRLSDRLGGHIVQGHVDGVGTIQSVKRRGENREFVMSIPKNLRRYLIPKGSVAIDGISMTVNSLTPTSFTLFVIPHTLQATNLKARRIGDRVNLEVDMIGKYIESLGAFSNQHSAFSKNKRMPR